MKTCSRIPTFDRTKPRDFFFRLGGGEREREKGQSGMTELNVTEEHL